MKISVGICTYNGERFLSEQLESILGQTMQADEIIVCDDNSSDGTLRILGKFFAENEGLIRIHRNEKNIGVIKNFEQVISYCSGDIIFLADQDDVWETNKVEKCFRFFQSNIEYSAVFTNAIIVDEYGEPRGTTLWNLLDFDPVKNKIRQSDLFKFMLFYGNVVAGNCLAIKSEALSLISPFRHIPGMWHDEWIAMKMAEHNKIGFISDGLTRYRMHDEQQTKWLWCNREERNKKRRSFFEQNAALYPLDYYKHWRRRAEFVKTLSENGFLIDDSLYTEILEQKKTGLISYLRSKSFFKRKLKLLKLKVKGDENISFLDLLQH